MRALATLFSPRAALALTTLAAVQSAPQEPAPKAQPPGASAAQQAGQALPPDTTAEARALWSALAEALRPQTGAELPTSITAFDLSIQTRMITQRENGRSQKNDVRLRYRFLSPGFVRTTLQDSKVERMRGPDGDWLWDPEKHDVVQLVGADFAQDRRELSQTLSIARNYLALAEPGRLRITRLERMRAPPAGLPKFDPADETTPKETALTRATSLDWIAVTSPDFQVVEALKSKDPNQAQPLFTAQIGLDPKSHWPMLAVIWQDEHSTMVAETAVLVDLIGEKYYKRIDGRLVPTYFRVHDPLLPSSPFSFQNQARVEVFVMADSTLNAKLSADDFRPPKK